jgi:predicted esterase
VHGGRLSMLGHLEAGVRRVRSARAIMLAGLFAGMPQPGAGQSNGGHLEERMASVTDTSQTYALYLPPGYTDDREWPILFVLDPRARAVLALRLFQETASELGWVVMSSYNSRSDSFPELNEQAMEAMLRSAQERLSINRSRLYLAGFSGTARAVLRFAVTLRGHVAGVIAVGGALGFELGGPETVFAGDSTFAYFGAAGTRDFNHDEVVAMADRFGTMHVPFRAAVFDGEHSWPPADVCRQAIEWLELRAMRSGRRAADSAWMRLQLQNDMARAADLDRLRQADKALRLYEAITRDYPPSPQASTAAERADVLSNTPAVKRYRAQVGNLVHKERMQAEDLQRVLRWARSSSDPPASETLVRKLKIAKLKETAERGDSLQAASAERLLARMFVWLAFYEPRAYIANHSPHRALTMFEAATRIGPIQGESCALLHAALRAGTPEQQMRLNAQCQLD